MGASWAPKISNLGARQEIWGPGILKLLLRNTEVSNEFIFLISKPKIPGAHQDKGYTWVPNFMLVSHCHMMRYFFVSRVYF